MRKLLFAFGASAGTIVAGCTAILGSFDVASTPATPDGGGPGDAAGGDAAGNASEAGIDAGPPPLGCTVDTTRQLDSVAYAGGGGVPSPKNFDRVLEVFRAGATVRIVTTRRAPGASLPDPGMVTYAFDPKSAAAITPIPIVTTGEVVDVRRQAAQNELAVLAVQRPGGVVPGDNGSVVVYQLPDSDSQVATPVALSANFQAPLEPKAQLAGALGLYATDDTYFWSISATRPSNTTAEIFIGKKTPTTTPVPVSVASGLPAGPRYTVRDLVRGGPNVYVFNAELPTTAAPANGTAFFVVPETGVLGAAPNLTPITPPGYPTGLFLVAAAAPSTGLRFAIGDVHANSAGASVDLRAGDLGAGQSTIDGTKFPAVLTLPTLLDAPLSAPAARISGDDLLWVGTPGDTQKGRGIDFVWFNYLANGVRADQTGVKRLLPLRAGITNSSVTIASAPTPSSGDFDLVWTEDNGTTTTLFWGDLHCK